MNTWIVYTIVAVILYNMFVSCKIVWYSIILIIFFKKTS